MLFGNFAEHLGRMIYGGIYEEGSPLSDPNGFRKDVMEAVKRLGVSILRWPGGNFASGYNWKDGIGPKDQRPARPELAWDDIETNRFGTDEFLQLLRDGSRPSRTSASTLGLGTIDDARHWVEYTNGARDTTGPSSGARTAASSRRTSSTGRSATRSTAPGSSGTRTRRTMRSSRSKRRRRCAASTRSSS